MKLSVRYFASLTDATGCTAEEIELPAGSNVQALWQALLERHPKLGDKEYRPMVACDLEYADWQSPLDGVCEVAFLPPVSGG